MRTSARLAAISGVTAVATALLTGTGLTATSFAATGPGSGHPQGGPAAGQVFVQTDSTTGNAIAVYDRTAGGALRAAGTYPTGGLGGVLAGSVVDHLASQGSLAYDRASRLLYAVNAGSDTVTVFSVAGDRLVRRQVISSGGTFPVSIAVHRNLVYVLNARHGGSVQGFLRIGARLIKVPAWHRSLGLDPAQTPEFTSTPGQVAFTPDGSRLIITTKGNGNDIDVFTVGLAGGLSARPAVTADPGNVPFAVSFDAGGHLAVAEAGPSAVATFTISRGGSLTLVDRQATGQAATCWITADGTRFYVSNAGSGTLSGYADPGSGALRSLGTTTTDAGTVDAAVSPDGRYLYGQAGGHGLVDEYRVNADGSLTAIGSVTVPGAAGGEGIAAS
jgi:6-phosphogluconolactonase (cycloisomerase 2 family)